jgi:hypothetical protein
MRNKAYSEDVDQHWAKIIAAVQCSAAAKVWFQLETAPAASAFGELRTEGATR